MKKNKAFTLAEVLVALMIIGVIAAITIPGLINTANSKQIYAALTKAQMTVANATGSAEAIYGPIRFWDWEEVIKKHYLKNMNVSEWCPGNKKCLPSKYTSTAYPTHWWSSSWKTFITTDGMYWAIHTKSDCSLEQGSPFFTKHGCAWVEVDVNGIKKPNKLGKDIFGFVVTPEGTFPFGGCPGCSMDECKDKIGKSWACTGRLLKEGKLSW